MKQFDAWHLPGFSHDDAEFDEYQIGDLPLRAPRLRADQLQSVIDSITIARDRTLGSTPVANIVDAIDRVARDFADSTSTEGSAARELLPLVTGYSPETVSSLLDHMIRDWGRASLEKLLSSELGDAEVLDHPKKVGPRLSSLARGPRLAYHVFSGNVPGVAVTSIVRSLLVKAATLGKTASGEPVFPVLFARALARHAPELAASLAVTYWPGGTNDLEEVALAAADTVIVYGGGEAVASISARAKPETRLLVHGPRLSFGIVGREATIDVAASVAAATAAYDQQGCVSPHVVYVERGGSIEPRELAKEIAEALAALATSQPRRKLTASESLAIHEARTRAEFRENDDTESFVFGSADTSYTVIYDEEQTLTTSCLNRTLYVKAVADANDVVAIIQPHHRLLQSAAIAGISAERVRDLARALTYCGVTRITSFDDLPWPRMWWHHDGRGPLQELISWHDIEV